MEMALFLQRNWELSSGLWVIKHVLAMAMGFWNTISGLNPSPDEVTEMIEEADRDNSGAIDFREFCSLMVKREREKETTEDIKQAFRVFDKVDSKTAMKQLWSLDKRQLLFGQIILITAIPQQYSVNRVDGLNQDRSIYFINIMVTLL